MTTSRQTGSRQTTERVVHMANQIALFFAARPKEEAVTEVAAHLKNFWEPRMREQLARHIAEGGSGLHELVLEAARRL
ncbi:MAG: formate dehydrogenase subunit delta [Bryobacteraceae bacterium]